MWFEIINNDTLFSKYFLKLYDRQAGYPIPSLLIYFASEHFDFLINFITLVVLLSQSHYFQYIMTHYFTLGSQ